MQVNESLENYRIIKEIGRGGMARVYLGQNNEKEPSTVAIKVLDDFLNDSEYTKRFKREAMICQKLSHPNIIKVLSFGSSNDSNFLVMEYVDGHDLSYFIKNHNRLSITQVINVFVKLLAALHYSHTLGVIHRDIKPQNILIGKNNEIKITDFGIAKISSSNELTNVHETIMGTTAYMSPEQIKSQEIDQRTDIYSLGIVVYEMLSGSIPYNHDTPWAVVKGHLYDTPKPLNEQRNDVPDYLISIINKSISKEKEDRYLNVMEIILDLKNKKIRKIPKRESAYLEDEKTNNHYELHYNEVFIGRKEINHIVLKDANTSRRHAKIKKENGSFVLEDLESMNGTYVNGIRVQSKVLEDNDKIKIGKNFLLFKKT